MSPITIDTVSGSITLSRKAAEYIVRQLPGRSIDTIRGAFSALGLDEEATSWAKYATNARSLQMSCDRVGRNSTEANGLRRRLETALAHAAAAWLRVQMVIDKCCEIVDVEARVYPVAATETAH